MRMVVDIPADQEAQLAALAARRGDNGFSRIIQEALEKYLADLENRREAVEEALSVIGSFSEEEAAELERHARSLRTN